MSTFANLSAHQKFEYQGEMYIRLRQGRKAMSRNGKIVEFKSSDVVKKCNS